MANLAAQIKDKFLGLVDCVAGCGRAGAGKDVQEPIKLHTVQVYRYPHASSIDLLVVSNTSCIHQVEYKNTLPVSPLLLQPIAIKPRDPNVSQGSKAGVNGDQLL